MSESSSFSASQPHNWSEQGQAWRTQHEISDLRKRTLQERLNNRADIEQGLYPFKDFRLCRADIEWLLASHPPIAWNDASQRQRWGLDLRGAILCGEDLSGLPLARLRGGLTVEERKYLASRWPQDIEKLALLTAAAAIYLIGANLHLAHLEGAVLRQAHLEGADLTGVLMGVSETSGFLDFSHEARSKQGLYEAQIVGTDLREAYLEKAILSAAKLERAVLIGTHLEGADLFVAHLEGAFINEAHFEGKKMDAKRLETVREYIDFPDELPAADLRGVFFDAATSMWNASLWNPQHRDDHKRQVVARFADARWSGANVAVLDWNAIQMLGDEYDAHGFAQSGKDRLTRLSKEQKSVSQRKKLDDYLAAVRTYRQVAAALQAQGSNEDAGKFSYRAQFLQRQVLRRQGRSGQYIFSVLLDSLAGYGYRPIRSLVAYGLIILGFMGLYLLNSHFVAPHLSWDEAIVLSISSFHGRGFFTQEIKLGDTYARLAASEAVIGLIIEISFIATFTQRFFGK